MENRNTPQDTEAGGRNSLNPVWFSPGQVPELKVISKELLQVKLEKIKEVIPKHKWFFYHIEALHNFINYLDKFSSLKSKECIYQSINDCLTLIYSEINEHSDHIQISKVLTHKIWEIADHYNLEFGFVMKPYIPGIIVFELIIFFALLYFFSILTILVIIGLISVAIGVYYNIKIKAGKYY